MPDQWRAPKRARGRLAQHGLSRKRFDLVHDVITAPQPVTFLSGFLSVLAAPRVRPTLDASAIQAFHIHDRNLHLSRLGKYSLNVRQRFPSRQAATSRPGLDGFENRLGLIPEYPAIQIN